MMTRGDVCADCTVKCGPICALAAVEWPPRSQDDIARAQSAPKTGARVRVLTPSGFSPAEFLRPSTRAGWCWVWVPDGVDRRLRLVAGDTIVPAP